MIVIATCTRAYRCTDDERCGYYYSFRRLTDNVAMSQTWCSDGSQVTMLPKIVMSGSSPRGRTCFVRRATTDISAFGDVRMKMSHLFPRGLALFGQHRLSYQQLSISLQLCLPLPSQQQLQTLSAPQPGLCIFAHFSQQKPHVLVIVPRVTHTLVTQNEARAVIRYFCTWNTESSLMPVYGAVSRAIS